MYAGLLRAGIPETEMPHIEGCIRARFLEYERERTQYNRHRCNLGMAVAKQMFGENMDAVAFAALPELHFADSLESIKKLFGDYRVAS
jgi:hypothetical protein